MSGIASPDYAVLVSLVAISKRGSLFVASENWVLKFLLAMMKVISVMRMLLCDPLR